jgi:hypothetical protein
MFNLNLTTMKTIGKRREKKALKGFRILNLKKLVQIKGGVDGPATIKDHDF